MCLTQRKEWLERYDRFASGAASVKERVGDPDTLSSAAAAAIAPVIKRSILASPPEIAALGEIASVNASALIAGPAAPEALASDRRVVTTMSMAPGGDAILAALRASPLTGCTSIMDFALAQSGWNPLDPRQFGNRAAFSKYLELLAASHFFGASPGSASNSLDLNRYPNPGAMAGAIAALLPGIDEADRQRVTDAIVHMAHNVFGAGSDHASAQATLFVQHAIAVGASDITAHIYWCQAVMHFDRRRDKSTITETMQNTFLVDRFDFTFQASSWPALAEEIARRKITDVQAWLRAASTPQRFAAA